MKLKLADETEVEVRFYHVRDTIDPERTIAVVKLSETENLYGVAIKNPTDQFNKRIGRKIALTRALTRKITKSDEKVNLPKNYREMIWKAYGKYTGAF